MYAITRENADDCFARNVCVTFQMIEIQNMCYDGEHHTCYIASSPCAKFRTQFYTDMSCAITLYNAHDYVRSVCSTGHMIEIMCDGGKHHTHFFDVHSVCILAHGFSPWHTFFMFIMHVCILAHGFPPSHTFLDAHRVYISAHGLLRPTVPKLCVICEVSHNSL